MTPDEALLPSTIPELPRCLKIRSITNGLISYSESQNYPTYKIAAHVFIWSPWEGQSRFGEYKAAVMMQMRFDGTLGFAGGLIKKGEDLLAGLSRELEEEISWDSSQHQVGWSDYYNTQVNKGKELIFHLFIKKIPYQDFVELEKRTLTARDYGVEVLGCVRVPTYIMPNEYGGLPAFINNKFVGGAKQQLLMGLHHTKVLDEAKIQEVVSKSQNLKLAASRF